MVKYAWLVIAVVWDLFSKKSIHVLYFLPSFPRFLILIQCMCVYVYDVCVYFFFFFNPVSSFKSIKINNPKTCAADRFREPRKKKREKKHEPSHCYRSPQSFWPFVPFPTVSVIIATTDFFVPEFFKTNLVYNKIYLFFTQRCVYMWSNVIRWSEFDIIYFVWLSLCIYLKWRHANFSIHFFN